MAPRKSVKTGGAKVPWRGASEGIVKRSAAEYAAKLPTWQAKLGKIKSRFANEIALKALSEEQTLSVAQKDKIEGVDDNPEPEAEVCDVYEFLPKLVVISAYIALSPRVSRQDPSKKGRGRPGAIIKKAITHKYTHTIMNEALCYAKF